MQGKQCIATARGSLLGVDGRLTLEKLIGSSFTIEINVTDRPAIRFAVFREVFEMDIEVLTVIISLLSFQTEEIFFGTPRRFATDTISEDQCSRLHSNGIREHIESRFSKK